MWRPARSSTSSGPPAVPRIRRSAQDRPRAHANHVASAPGPLTQPGLRDPPLAAVGRHLPVAELVFELVAGLLVSCGDDQVGVGGDDDLHVARPPSAGPPANQRAELALRHTGCEPTSTESWPSRSGVMPVLVGVICLRVVDG